MVLLIPAFKLVYSKLSKMSDGWLPRISSTTLNSSPLIVNFASGTIFIIFDTKSLTLAVIPFILMVEAPTWSFVN
jgi:hypothetical protein